MEVYKLENIAKEICAQSSFVLINTCGAGAFKETFHIKNTNNENEALKIFKEGQASKRTEREVQAMRKCTHQNVGKLKTVSSIIFKQKEYLYFIEEFLSGGNLAIRLQNNFIDRSFTINIGKMLINAIAHIASHQLVHRDIKPENVMFREDGVTAVLVDFGLVRNLMDDSLTPTWVMQGPGTPLFSSPEQLNNEKDLIDWRTDQFSLGLVLALCLLGHHPYGTSSDSQIDIVERIARKTGIPEDNNKRLINLRMKPLVKMISPWPIKRFRTPSMLVESWNKLS